MQKKSAVALGYFDGVHLGHRRILGAAAAWAAANGCVPAAFTFHFGEKRTKGADILTLSERCRRIRGAGAERVLCEEFDAIAELSPEEFVEKILCEKLDAAAVFCGDNFRFGAKAAGDVALLHSLCAARGIAVQVFPLEESGGEPVSATRIRGLLEQGRIEEANALLGEPYAIDLPVQHGRGVGRTMGFPTVNQIYPPTMQRPAQGVYITAAELDGAHVPAATGIGSRPTVGGHTVTCESFLCRWQGDAYGAAPRISFYRYLQPVQKFDSVEQLAACIDAAAQASSRYFDETLTAEK